MESVWIAHGHNLDATNNEDIQLDNKISPCNPPQFQRDIIN
jgi:hypothetical protein